MINTFPEIDAFCAKYGVEQGLYFLSLYYTYCSCVGEVLYVFNNDRFMSQFNERFLDRLISEEGKEFSSQWLNAIDPYSKNQDSKIHNEMRNNQNIVYIPEYFFMTEFFIFGKQLSTDEKNRFEQIKNEHNNLLVNPIAGQSDNDEIISLAEFLKKYGEKKGTIFLKLFYSSQTSMNALRHSGLKESAIEEYSHFFYNKVVSEFGDVFAQEWIRAIDSFMNYSPHGLLAELYCDSDIYIDKKYVDYAVSFARNLNADESNLLHLFDGAGKDLRLFNHIDALKKAILSYNEDKSDESISLFANALRAVINSHDWIVTLHSVRNDGTIRIDYRIQRGFPYLSCYTSEDEIKAPPVGFDNMEAGDFCSILPTLFKKKSI